MCRSFSENVNHDHRRIFANNNTRNLRGVIILLHKGVNVIHHIIQSEVLGSNKNINMSKRMRMMTNGDEKGEEVHTESKVRSIQDGLNRFEAEIEKYEKYEETCWKKYTLNEDQKKIVEHIQQGRNIAVIGHAKTGKHVAIKTGLDSYNVVNSSRESQGPCTYLRPYSDGGPGVLDFEYEDGYDLQFAKFLMNEKRSDYREYYMGRLLASICYQRKHEKLTPVMEFTPGFTVTLDTERYPKRSSAERLKKELIDMKLKGRTHNVKCMFIVVDWRAQRVIDSLVDVEPTLRNEFKWIFVSNQPLVFPPNLFPNLEIVELLQTF